MDMEFLQSIGLAAAFGFFGQSLRAAVGLKKQADEEAAAGKPAFENFSVARFVLSLVLGMLAGEASWLALYFLTSPEAADMSKGAAVFAVIAAGYAGADSIEGLAKRYLAK